ncbi:MAG: FMN-binding glutamate synthase family protein [Planctomycetota bacterium]
MWWWILWVVLALLGLLAIWDVFQRKHAILRNFPIVGHFRYLLEMIGPELRQYIVTANDEEQPFNRDQRRWVYASSKKQDNYFGFGTDNDLERSDNHLVIKHATFPVEPPKATKDGLYAVPCAKVLGEKRGRAHKFRPASVINISAMSYGSLSAPAVEALNEGSRICGCIHNTGEGGVASYHQKGADLIWQIGTGYFGCRSADGGFDLAKFKEVVEANPIRAIELKLSQGAKPGMGGILPAAKITPEISEIRGIPMGVDCVSPSGHSAFSDVDSLLDFVEMLASETGLPIGIKSAVGDHEFGEELSESMASGVRGVDFITVDGGEGGTGAGPLVFTDHVSLPFKLGFTRVYTEFARRGIHQDVVFVGSAKLGFPEASLLAFSLGCDLINVGREAMMAIGCIQAQRCHNGHCPTGVATQNKWLMRGLDPTHKAARLANYVVALRKELHLLTTACGVPHPGLVTSEHLEILDDAFGSRTPREVFGYDPGWGLPSPKDRAEITKLMCA